MAKMTDFIRAACGTAVIGAGSIVIGLAIASVLPYGGVQINQTVDAPARSEASTVEEAPVSTAQESETIEPEAATGFRATESAVGQDFMMVAAHPVASQIGAQVLASGGSAVDAIIAAQMALTLLEPQSSGIGGGGFLLVWDPENQKLHSYDGRETAPQAGSIDFIYNEDGSRKPFRDLHTGGAAVGVPGLLRMLESAHLQHGISAWSQLFLPAIDLAEEGFPVSPRLHQLLGSSSAKYLNEIEPAASYFYLQDGTPKPVGTILTNTELGKSLRAIADGGADVFYAGPLGRAIVERVQTAERNPGALSEEDMANYQAIDRGEFCNVYKVYRVCGMPPPSSGGSTVLQILGLLEHAGQDIAEFEPGSVRGNQVFLEAMRLAFADRNRYVADIDFVPVPLAEMLGTSYLTKRAMLMDLGEEEKTKQPAGNPTLDHTFLPHLLDNSPELPSTTHIVAVDRNGMIASMTSSIEQAFGSRLMVGGFLLNNQLTDFAWSDMVDGELIANRYEPGKRPRSSMAPTIVFDEDGAPILALGSPGGSRIIGYVARTLVGTLDWGLSLQEAIDSAHVINRNGTTDVEDRPEMDGLALGLQLRGYEVNRRALNSGLHGIDLSGPGLIGAADPRREGLAVGEHNLTTDYVSVFNELLEGH